MTTFPAKCPAALFLITARPVHAETVLGRGTFVGKSNHDTSGAALLVRTDRAGQIRLGADTRLDSAPDPWVGFGSCGRYVEASELAKLRASTGARSYAVPAPVDVSKYDEIYVWCKKFGVPLGMAKIRSSRRPSSHLGTGSANGSRVPPRCRGALPANP